MLRLAHRKEKYRLAASNGRRYFLLFLWTFLSQDEEYFGERNGIWPGHTFLSCFFFLLFLSEKEKKKKEK